MFITSSQILSARDSSRRSVNFKWWHRTRSNSFGKCGCCLWPTNATFTSKLWVLYVYFLFNLIWWFLFYHSKYEILGSTTNFAITGVYLVNSTHERGIFKFIYGQIIVIIQLIKLIDYIFSLKKNNTFISIK